jgi:NAD(P)-dependent dehydrogenase (short-subunit alcohol dehydrogenase family)
MTQQTRRVALVQQAGGYVGPALCRQLATSGHDLVVHAPQAGLVDRLAAAGAAVAVVPDLPETGPGSLLTPEGWAVLCDTALERFGRLDAAALFPPSGGTAFTRGPFMDASVDDLRGMVGYYDATFHALQAVLPVLLANPTRGQVVVFTSDAGARPEAGWSLYGAVRAGQTFLVQAVALEVAGEGVCVNAIGSKNAVSPDFPLAPAGAATDASVELGDWAAPLLAETPLPRLGTMDELAAFAAVLLDGRNRFQTAQYFSFSGGWNAR